MTNPDRDKYAYVTGYDEHTHRDVKCAHGTWVRGLRTLGIEVKSVVSEGTINFYVRKAS